MPMIDFSRGELTNLRRFLNRGIDCAEGRCPNYQLCVTSYVMKPIMKKIRQAFSELDAEEKLPKEVSRSEPQITQSMVNGEALLDEDIITLFPGLPVRAFKGIRRAIIGTVNGGYQLKEIRPVLIRELVGLTANDLLEMKNFGQTSLYKVREALGKLGLALKGETVE